MAAQSRELELLDLFNRHEILRLRGYSFVISPQGGVIVDRWGHVRGVWQFRSGKYAWTSASHTQPEHWAEDAAAAVRYTLATLTIT